MTNLKKEPMDNEKKDSGEKKKKNAMSADLSFDSIRNALNGFGKKTKSSDGVVVPDNSSDDFVPGLPEVNLLPPKVKEIYAAKDLGKKFTLWGGGLVGVFALLFGVSFVSANIYEDRIEEINTATAGHQVEISGLNSYSGYRTSIDGKRSEIASVVKGQVDVGAVNTAFKKAAEGAGYDLSSVSLSISGGDAAVAGACVNPDPFTPATGIGCVTFSLTGDGNLSNLYNISGKDSGFVNIYVPSALNGEEGATIDGSVSITEKFYLTDYEDLVMPLDSVLQGEALPEDTTGEDLGEGK